MNEIELPGVEVFVEPVREHRFVLVLRGEGLSEALTETDPQQEGVTPLECLPTSDDATATAEFINDFFGWIIAGFASPMIHGIMLGSPA